MLYICIDLPRYSEEYWFELDDDYYARRQIIIDKITNDYVISCGNDCLAEGVVDLDELEGDKITISQTLFEEKWSDLKKRYEKEWQIQKKNIL